MELPIRNQRETVRTGALLVAIPVVLTLIHIVVPPSVQSVFVFDHSRFRVYTLWTSSFVHLDWGHLGGNLLGYTLAVAALWMITYERGTQSGLRHTVLVFVFFLPPLVSVFDYLSFRYVIRATESAATRGFSGIAAALLGLVLVAAASEVYVLIKSRQETLLYTMAIVLLSLGGIVVKGGIGTIRTYALLGLGVSLLSVQWIRRMVRLERPQLKQIVTEQRQSLTQLLYASLVVVVLVPLMFPIDWVGTNSVTNIFGHFAGFVLGTVIGAIFVTQYSEWQVSME
jgi:membrane associated rhomboid family serine protease